MSTKLSTRHMQMVIAVADAGNVSAAASQIGVTQSALSHRIREAERLLNTELFYRKNKKLIPTSAGKRLLHSARIVIGELERAENDIDKLSVGIEHVVRMGNDAYSGYHWLPRFLRVFAQTYPAISVEVMPDVTLDPYTALRNGSLDLSIISGVVTQSGLQTLPLFQDEMVALLPEAHPNAGKPWLAAAEIAADTYITYHTTPGKGREYEQVFSRYNVLPAKVIRAGVTEAVVAFVREGFGTTILPAWTAQPYLQQGGLTTARVTESGVFIDWQVLLRKDERPDSPISTFAGMLQQVDLRRL